MLFFIKSYLTSQPPGLRFQIICHFALLPTFRGDPEEKAQLGCILLGPDSESSTLVVNGYSEYGDLGAHTHIHTLDDENGGCESLVNEGYT